MTSVLVNLVACESTTTIAIADQEITVQCIGLIPEDDPVPRRHPRGGHAFVVQGKDSSVIIEWEDPNGV